MQNQEIRARLRVEAEIVFGNMERTLARIPEERSDPETYETVRHIAGEFDGVLRSAECLGIDLGRVKMDPPVVKAIRARVLRERKARIERSAALLTPDTVRELERGMKANVGRRHIHR